MSEHAKSFAFGDWTLNDILNDQRPELKNALFRIPDYQRGYAWEKRQLEEFWEDLHSKRKSHYMGAITVERKITDSDSPVYEVVDGQQRLTTIALLLSVLPEANILRSRFSYEESNENGRFFKAVLDAPAFVAVSSPDGTTTYPAPASLTAPQNVYQRNLVAAKSFFSEKVSERSPGELSFEDLKKRAVGDSVDGRLEFDFRILRPEYDAGVVFETMNNRGKPLTLLEKLKNRLMYLAEIVDDEEESDEDDNPDGAVTLRESINSAWGEIYRALASDPDRDPLDEDEFIAAHLSVYRNPKESVYSEVVAEARLFKMFCESPDVHPKSETVDETDERAMSKARLNGMMESPLSLAKIKQYVDDLRTFAPVWTDIHGQFDNACGRCRLLSGSREVKTFLASVWLALPENEQGKRNGDNGVFSAAERLLFRNTVRGVIDQTTFSTLARRLHGTCLDQLKGDDATNISVDEVRQELEVDLEEEQRKISADTLVQVFSDRMDRQQSPYGFYGWPGLKYFLFTQENGNGCLPWSRFDEASIEHVIPQSSTADGYDGWWKRQIQDFVPVPAGSHPDENERKECRRRKRALVNSLGNFVLLTQAENASVSDDPWESYDAGTGTGSHKAVVGKKAFYADPNHVSSTGARVVAETAGSWNAYRVRERGRKLFKELATRLGVEVNALSEHQIDTALGFVPGGDLENAQFGALPETEVARLAPRFGTAAEPTSHGESEATNRNLQNVAEEMARFLEKTQSPGDHKNNQVCLWKTGNRCLNLRFTTEKCQVTFNFVVDDKIAFANRYGDTLLLWGQEHGFRVLLGKTNGWGNGIQFKPTNDTNVNRLDFARLNAMGNLIIEKLRETIRK